MVCVREKLFARLGQPAYRNFAEATRLCRSWRHEYVEIEHWLSASMSHANGDLALLCHHYRLDTTRVVRDLDKILQTLPGRNATVADLSCSLESAVERGLLLNQLGDDAAQPVRSIHIFLSLLEESGQQRKLYRLSEEFKKLPLLEVFDSWPAILAHSEEQSLTVSASAEPAPKVANDEVLTRWCSDLTEMARQGEIDPVVGRDDELRQLLDVLLRRRQNNPILVGEAGVGKTAVVEALARLIASGDVPPMLQPARLLSLDLGRIQAGASARGEFEARLKALMDAVAGSPQPVLLFCDEAHTLVGAGGQAGTGDAVNLLKPMLARGELRMIAATTWSEYKQFIEPDAALTRRFQAISVDEPDAEHAIIMLRAVAEKFARHHQVMIRDSAITAAVTLSMRNLPARQLPDKAISLLDTACARVALAQHIEPAGLVACRAELAALQQERAAIEAERHLLSDAELRLMALDGQIQQCEQEQRQSLDALESARSTFAQGQPAQPAENDAPVLIPAWVDDRVIADVLSDWTGIPSGRMLQSDVDTTLELESRLGDALFGQPLALQQIAQAVRIARSGLQNPRRPLGVFMLTGPTGTGKTETARVLADAIYGGEHNLITFNMSEFKEAHSVSALKGAPPGYVGYGKGGKLTEAVRRNPWSVLLLDEFEKAHPDIHELFYQLFDRGVMEDGEGRQVSFRHCFILLTSNLGADELTAAVEQDEAASLSTLRPLAHDALSRVFSPALLARMSVVPYLPLSRDTLVNIAYSRLRDIRQRLQQSHQLALQITDDVPQWLAARAAAHPSRGRAVENLLQQTLLPALSLQLLQRQRSNEPVNEVVLQIDDDAMTLHFDSCR